MAFRVTLMTAVATAVALLSVATSAPVAAATAVVGCATPADIGSFIGWCACSTVVTPRQVLSPLDDDNCDVMDVPTPTYYCDKAGRGNCDLQCAAAILECTGALEGGRCPCAKKGVRAVLRYNGPLGLANMP